MGWILWGACGAYTVCMWRDAGEPLKPWEVFFAGMLGPIALACTLAAAGLSWWKQRDLTAPEPDLALPPDSLELEFRELEAFVARRDKTGPTRTFYPSPEPVPLASDAFESLLRGMQVQQSRQSMELDRLALRANAPDAARLGQNQYQANNMANDYGRQRDDAYRTGALQYGQWYDADTIGS